jgi:ribosomal protein L7/L12
VSHPRLDGHDDTSMSDWHDIEKLALGGQKILAIKELRSRTGVGLKEAKDAVEWFEAHRQWPAQYDREADPNLRPAQATTQAANNRRAEVEQQVAQQHKIGAIKLVREITSFGLKEAKDAVEHFQAHGVWQPEILAAFGEPPTQPASVTAAQAQPAAQAASRRRAEVEQQVAQQQKIGAIKLLREINSSFGLREAKDAVEHFQAHGVWQPEILAAFGEPPTQPASVTAAQARPEPPRAAVNTSRDPQLASVLQALANALGYAPEVRLAVRARRAPYDGQLVMLGDRACFVREERGQWVVDPMISYGMVTRVEAQSGSLRTVLYVSAAYLHERFELDGPDADAALALFRVFAP